MFLSDYQNKGFQLKIAHFGQQMVFLLNDQNKG